MASNNITPQYQSYGESSSRRTDQSPMEALTFKVPLTPISKALARKRKVKVMDEDEYVAKVEKIIERDFFPELDKLKAQSDYIDARERKDYETMSRLEEKYSGVRPKTGNRLQSPATFETPQDDPRESDPRRNQAEADNEFEKEEEEGEKKDEEVEKQEEDKMTLDQFMANNTSEDNESFIDIQTENEKRHRLKNGWMYKDETLYLEMKAQQMALPSIDQQAALPYKPGNVDTWTYQNINSVFHNPDGLELTEKEKIEKAKKEKIILHDNTRLVRAPWKSEKQEDRLRREVENREAREAGKVGVDGKELTRPETPSVNGFKLMSMTPSPALGLEDSPLMTWGEVVTTPYMLTGCETPLVTGGTTAGTGFTIKDLSSRDKIALQLADNNSRYYRERKQKAVEQVRSSLKAGKGLSGMSPAAQRLASGKLGIRLGTDSMLKASYTPSPSRGPGSTPTPRSTPGRTPGGSRNKVTPSLGVRTKTPGTGKSSADITDNLLDIKISQTSDKNKVNTDNLLNISTNRPRASDFFKK